MYNRYIKNEYILKDYSNKYRYYGDFGFCVQANKFFYLRCFKEKGQLTNIPWYEVLYKQYPSSKFILNIRPLNNLLKSNYMFRGGINIRTVKKQYRLIYKKDIDIMLDLIDFFYKYNCMVLKFFSENNIEKNLIVYDIENDPISKLVKYFNNFNLTLDSNYYKKHFVAKKISKHYDRRLSKWLNIAREYPELTKKGNLSTWIEIKNKCALLNLSNSNYTASN